MKLADLFVEFSVKGTKAFNTAMTAASAAVTGFALAGFRGTVQSEMMAFQMQRLSREVASLFIPAMDSATRIVGELTKKFQGLSGQQQDAIGKSLLLAGGVMASVRALSAMGFTINPVVGAIMALSGAMLVAVSSTEKGAEAFGKMETALTRLGEISAPAVVYVLNEMASVVDSIANKFGHLAELIEKPSWSAFGTVLKDYAKSLLAPMPGASWLLDKLAPDEPAEGGKKGGHRTVSEPSRISSATEWFKQIQTDMLKRGEDDYQKQTAGNTKQTADKQDDIIKAIKQLNPAITNGA